MTNRTNHKNRYIKGFNSFVVESALPNIKRDISDVISGFHTPFDLFRAFKINKDEVSHKSNIQSLYNNKGFNDSITKRHIKKGPLQATTYMETLLDDKYVLFFFFLYDADSVEIEEPKYVVLQYIDDESQERSSIMSFENDSGIESFYEKLTDDTIEVEVDGETYVYKTTNGGNNWELKNVQVEVPKAEQMIDRDALRKLLSTKGVRLL